MSQSRQRSIRRCTVAAAGGAVRPALLVLGAALAAALLGAVLHPAPARAYVPGLEALYTLVAARQPPMQRARIETRTYVFDPLNRSGEGPTAAHPDALPPELEARGFRQQIWWIRNRFLGIETYAEDGTLLHFYLDEGFRPVMGNRTAERRFREADVVPPFLPFLATDPAEWRQAVTYWGINPRAVDLARGPKGEVLYRLLEDEGRALWLEPGRLRPVKLRTELAGVEPPQQLTIEFSEFLFVGGDGNNGEEFSFPRTVNFLLDGRLFKQTVVLSFEADPNVQGFPVTKLRKLAAEVQATPPVSLQPATGVRP